MLPENSNELFIFVLALHGGGKKWPSMLRSPKRVYDSLQKSNIRDEESSHRSNSFPKRISCVLKTY